MEGTVVSTDAFEMAVAHRVFRNELHNASKLIGNVKAGDTARSSLIAAHLELIMAALHHHHAAEDELIWPKLHARTPAFADVISRMEQAHRVIADAYAAVESTLESWITSADGEIADHLIEDLEGPKGLCTRVDEHLTDEERHIVPLINQYISPEEWQQCAARGTEFLSRRKLKLALVLGGLTFDAASPDEARRILANVPIPQRILIRLLGRRATAGYQATLYGSAV